MKITSLLFVTIVLFVIGVSAQIKPPSESAMDRFLRYVKIDTQSAEDQERGEQRAHRWQPGHLVGCVCRYALRL